MLVLLSFQARAMLDTAQSRSGLQCHNAAPCINKTPTARVCCLSRAQGGLASMGCGLPSAIGAAMANPQATCLAVCGDGGFAMTSQELMMAKVYKLNVKVSWGDWLDLTLMSWAVT